MDMKRRDDMMEGRRQTEATWKRRGVGGRKRRQRYEDDKGKGDDWVSKKIEKAQQNKQ